MTKKRMLTMNGVRLPRILSFVSGLGMMAAAILTIRHFFIANYPESIFQGSFCDISAFFNCDASVFSSLSQIMGVPLGFFGLIVGALVALGALFPSEDFEKTNTFIGLLNGLGVIGLLAYSVFVLRSLCLFCSGYYLFALLSLFLFWRFGLGRFRPSIKMLATFACITVLGAYGMIAYHDARRDAQAAAVMRVVNQYFELPEVGDPSFISPYWTARATDVFEEAPIRIVEYVDFLCPDCLFLTQQLDRLKAEFEGKINIAFQFFPLEARCNAVVDKDLHPGACELSYIAAYDPALFQVIHDEIFLNFNTARSPEWRRELAQRYGVEEALNDPYTQNIVQTIINTGAEYEKTSDRFAHGIRSTPTMIINGRMVIGTLPDEHLRAIFQALVEQKEGRQAFIENWVPPQPRRIRR